MFFGTGSKLVPILLLTNFWTVALLFLSWNSGARHEVVESVKTVTERLGVSTHRIKFDWANIHDDGDEDDFREPKGDAHTSLRNPPVPVEPARDPSLPSYCPECGEGDLLCAKYGKPAIARSVAYGGASARLLRVLENARNGKPTKIGVIGGSVTIGHGVKPEQNWPVLFEKWWKTTFPKSSTTLINGAVAATGSEYFAMCFLEHIDQDVDLVILEVAINDQRYEMFAEANEWLLRALLDLPHKPAILNLQTMGLMFDAITTGGDLHTALMNYYDVPSISIRNPLLPQIFAHHELADKWFAHNGEGELDLRHLGAFGHRMLTDLLIHFIQTRICLLHDPTYLSPPKTLPQLGADDDDIAIQPGDMISVDKLEDVPRLRLFDKYHESRVQDPIQPYCMTISSDRHKLKAWKSSGWEYWTWQSPTNPHNKKPYFRSMTAGSLTTFKVKVGAMGRVRVTFLKSATFGLGKALCWVGPMPPVDVNTDGDDWQWNGWDEGRDKGKVMNGYWQLNINIASSDVVSTGITPGDHLLHCEVMQDTEEPNGGHEVRLIAVDSA